MRVAGTIFMTFTVLSSMRIAMILHVRLGMRLAKTTVWTRRLCGFRGIAMRFRRGFAGRAGVLAGRDKVWTRTRIRPGMAAVGLVAVRLPWWLDAPKCPAKIVEFPFVREFLAFGHLDQFENFVDPINQFPQALGNLGGMHYGLVNCGSVGGAKIGGFDPRLLGGIIGPAFLPLFRPVFLPGRHRLGPGRRGRLLGGWSSRGNFRRGVD